MDVDLDAMALGEFMWIALAFGLGFLSRLVGLPPLVGFLAAGFLLSTQGGTDQVLLQKLADLGITLLLFTVGLKLNLGTLARPQVWAVTGIHTLIVVAVFGFAIFGLALVGSAFVAPLDFQSALLIAFALSFSSTVFVVKVLEEKGEMSSLHGRIAIGILIMQDVAAVIFLAVSSGKVPSPWALLLLLLIPFRPLLHQFLRRVGHGELMVLYGFLLALGGAKIFELVGMKGDLGALIVGVLIAGHPKSEEMAKTMMGFKDLFLLGFFLSVGLAAQPTWETFLVGALVTPLVFLKSGLFLALLVAFNLRARTALLSSLSLTSYSEFGLIVAAIGVSSGWINSEWLIIIAIALSLSFVISAGLNVVAHSLYSRYPETWRRWQREERLPDDRLVNIGNATIAVVGMGGVGTGAYDMMRSQYGEAVVGVDIDPVTVRNQQLTGRNVIVGDPSDADFWDRVHESHTLEQVMLALPKPKTSLAVLERLKETAFTGQVAATAKFPDEEVLLKEGGATTVFNIYAEAGAGFANHVDMQLQRTISKQVVDEEHS